MILVAVIVGYILGVMPFIVPKILEKKEEQIELRKDEEEVRRKREDIMIERMTSRNHYDEKCDNFKKGYYY